MFHKLRNQLFLAFLSVGFLSLIQAVVQVTLTHQKEKVENAIKQMHLIEMNVMLQAKAINDFFALETRNTEFFKTQHSVYLANRQKLQEEFKSTGKFLPENRFFKDIDTERHYKKLDILSESLNKYVDSIATMIYLRGFKDYGIEGQMREKAHALEN